MKKKSLLLLPIFGILLLSCENGSQKNNESSNTDSLTAVTDSVIIAAPFLITNSSVGYFQIGENWQNIAKSKYNYQPVQGYGLCSDACCDGGFNLQKSTATAENIDITIGALRFGESQSESEHKNNPDVFYSSSDNCSGWYFKDKMSYMVIYSEEFKTKEAIGAGSTLENVKEKFEQVNIEIGLLEEDQNAIRLKLNAYPNIDFILDVEDAIGGYEKISTVGQTASISDFKPNTKIKRLIISSSSNL